MATIPSANTSVANTASASVAGQDTICILAPVPNNADITPRQYGSPDAVKAQHGYSEGVEYAAMHKTGTRKPFIFVGLPIDVQGALGRFDTSGNSDTSVCSVAAGADGCLTEHEGIVRVVTGGTVGTDQIVIEYSLDDGFLFKKVRLGTDDEYEIPDVGVTIAFAAGDLTAGDTVLTWKGTGPRAAMADIQTACETLGAGMKLFRSLLLCGDMQSDTEAAAVLDEMDAYETENQRFAYARVSLYDRLPQAELSHTVARKTGTPTLTFAEVGSGIDTVTRSGGSWIADGFAVGDTVTFSGTGGTNDVTGVIGVLTALVMTVSVDLADQVTANASVVGYPTLTFAEIGAGSDTITRNRGSWLADGFRVADLVTVDGTSLNETVVDAVVSNVTALVLTLGGGAGAPEDLAAEVISTNGVTLVAGQTKAAWMAELDAEFEDIDAAPHIDMSAGRARSASPYSSWNFRRPAGWYVSVREYQHDLHIPTWQKKLGPLGCSLEDADGNLVEWDDRADGAAGCAARFTTLRTWGNGPRGAFVALSLTRDDDDNLTSRTHNAAVVNLACGTVQVATEDVVGVSLVLNDDGTATSDSLSTIELAVNTSLALALLSDRGEGARASKAVWSASRTDVLNVPEATITGVLELNLRGTVHTVNTTVRVSTGGQ